MTSLSVMISSFYHQLNYTHFSYASQPLSMMRFFIFYSKKLISQLVGNRTGRALAGLLVDYVGTTTVVGLSFFVTPLLLAFLSVPMYGFWITVTQIIFFLNLVDGGANIYLLKGIASAQVEGDTAYLAHVISTTFWFYVALGGLMLGIGLALSPFIAGWLKVSATESAAATVAFQLMVLAAAISLVAIPTFYGILQGYQQLALVNGIVYCVSISSSLLALGLLMLHLGVEAMALGQLGATLLGAMTALFFAWRVCPSFSLSIRHFRWAELRQILRFTGFFQMSKLAFLTSTFSDNILIAGYYGTAAVATYSLTQKLSGMSAMFVNKVGGAVMPGLAAMFAVQDTVRLQIVVLRLTRGLTRFGFLSLLLIVTLNERFVTTWVGSTVFGGLALTILFAYSVFRNGLIRNLSVIFFSSGQLEGWGWLSLAEAVLKIGMILMLLPGWGLLAPMFGTVVAELLTGVYTPIRVAQMIQLPLSTFLWNGIAIPLLKSLPTVGALLIIGYLVPTQWSWLGIICIGSFGLLINTLSFDGAKWLDGLNRLAQIKGNHLRLPAG